MDSNNKIKAAVAGVGGRGYGMMELFIDVEGVEVVAVCDPYHDRAENAAKRASVLQENKKVNVYYDHKEMFETEKNLDCVLITSSWATHALIAVEAMRHGVFPAMECGGGCSVNESWMLVRTSEQTGVPCMFLENCCYGREEMTLLRMIKAGLFGELIHAQGGYEHDLRAEVAFGRENRHYRFDNYKNRCAEIYPAHALGPIMKYLNINRNNRLLSLTSTASKARGLHEFIMDKKGSEYDASHYEFKQGDVVTTVIKCAHDETIVLTHDTTLPRPYSRGGRVQGTKGIWMEDNYSLYLEGLSKRHDVWEPFGDYINSPDYEHPLWSEFRTSGVKGGHGGMDFLVLAAFADAVANKKAPPIDVYDTAVLLSISALSEESIALGSMPVAIPDFTDGKWIRRESPVVSKYALDDVYMDRYNIK